MRTIRVEFVITTAVDNDEIKHAVLKAIHDLIKGGALHFAQIAELTPPDLDKMSEVEMEWLDHDAVTNKKTN